MNSVVNDTLAECVTFELRGPMASLTQVEGHSVAVIRQATDWADVVGDRPITDNRNQNLQDLIPRQRDLMGAILAGIMGRESEGQDIKVANKPPRMR